MAKEVLPTYSICKLTNEPASPNIFMADRFSHYLSQHADLVFPHKHSFYHLVYFTKGSGSHAIDFITYPVKPGDMYFMAPAQVHSWNFKGEADGYIINFSGLYLQSFLADQRYLERFSFFFANSGDQVISVPPAAQNELVDLFEKLLRAGATKGEFSDDLVRLLLIQVFVFTQSFSRAEELSGKKYNSLVLRNFQKLIEEQYREKKLTKDYAASLYVTPNHLNALAKDITGKSAGELIRDRVLLEAKRLLINADLSVSEIANELDFSDNSYFTKFFKKYAGVTPENFRKQFEHKRHYYE